MIQTYLISIIIWGIMILGSIYLFEDKIKENGWLEMPKSKKNPWLTLFFMSAMPLLRVIFFVTILIMCSMTTEQFDEWQAKR